MVRRILVAGLGGFGGLVLWYVLCSHLGWGDKAIQPEMRGLILCVGVCGFLAMTLGEEFRIIPTQEQVDKELKPFSIFSTDDQDPESGPKPKAPALSCSEPESAAIPEAMAEEIKRRTAQILATGPGPELVIVAGEPGGVLTFKHAPNKGPAILLFSTPYAARDYIRAVGAKAAVRQMKTAGLPGAARNWISRGMNGFVLNRCPRCSPCLLGDLRDLSTSHSYFQVWAVDQAIRSCKGEIQVRKILAHYETGSLAQARANLELIRDHIDCGIPYVYQLIAYIAGTQQDTAAKSAACERLKEFGPQFEWSPAYDRHDSEGRRAGILASATAGLLGSFGMLPSYILENQPAG
ncbi:MAG TPA: hypothetical protein VNY05_40050 [Candidatus Acidoferrales bacterium]|nr:hypothetical protein [Candidatus Acidoferrales bacterium]